VAERVGLLQDSAGRRVVRRHRFALQRIGLTGLVQYATAPAALAHLRLVWFSGLVIVSRSPAPL
jgi:hypothetical protein